MPYYTKVGNSWIQPAARAVPIQRTIQDLREILEMGTDSARCQYSHFDLIVWCEAFSVELTQQGVTLSSLNELALNIADDVHGTWSIYLFETYPGDELRDMDADGINLPQSYWNNWLTILSMNEKESI